MGQGGIPGALAWVWAKRQEEAGDGKAYYRPLPPLSNQYCPLFPHGGGHGCFVAGAGSSHAKLKSCIEGIEATGHLSDTNSVTNCNLMSENSACNPTAYKRGKRKCAR